MLPPKIAEKICRRLELLRGWRYAKVADVPLEVAETMEHFRTPPLYLKFEPAPIGKRWGKHWGTAWFRGTIQVPRTCKGRKVFYRHVSFSDKLLFVDGAPYAGMNPHHEEALLLRPARGGESLALYVEAYAGHPIPGVDAYRREPYTHQFCDMDPGREPPLALEASELLVERETVSAFYYDANVLFRTALALAPDTLRRFQILEGLHRALDVVPVHWDNEEELENSARSARKLLAPLLAARNAGAAPSAGVVGHAHIDVAWLWPLRESIRKAARTFATALQLMDEYPEFRFIQTQPVLYDLVEAEYPDLIPRIRKRVKEGRWEPNGGMWLEADCNVPSGESLVRQFLEGRKKSQELFGYQADTLWLPDVFGYSAALPQILRKCDIDHFVTSKINWNDTNRFPYDTFWWRGIDGSEVFTQFITTPAELGGYNAQLLPDTLQTSWNQVQRKDAQDGVLVSVGWGDGGGGPTREMCEHAARMKDLEGCPKTEFVSAGQYLKRQREQEVRRPRWSGELYLELHRGTLTTQARTKRYNRKLELLLRDVELLSAWAMVQGEGFEYPANALQQHWRTLLTNQFHDILPGTAIRQVYETAEAQYAEMERELGLLRTAALSKLGERLLADSEGAGFLVANTLSWTREEVMYFDAPDFTAACDAEGRPLPCQRVEERLAVAVALPALGAAPIALRKKATTAESVFTYSGKALETPFYSVAFDKAGKILALYDKEHKRELVREGKRLNDFYTADDIPVFWDAWDIERYYRDTIRYEERLLAREVVSDGPLLCVVRSTYQIGRASTLRQDMIFYGTHRRIEFRTEVNWHERQTLLKVGFGLNLQAEHYRSEIQFGHVTRPLHANTSWDQARFESCAHKWMDISEGDYGVALLNDCKYGHDVLDDMLSLTLLRSPLAPDASADQGAHTFMYALLPHAGDFTVKSVVREAYALNVPLVATPQSPGASGQERLADFFTVSNSHAVVESVKKSETGDAVVIRLYEAGRTRGRVSLAFTQPLKRAEECNLLEEREQPLAIKEQKVTLRIQPFEIKTVRVYLK